MSSSERRRTLRVHYFPFETAVTIGSTKPILAATHLSTPKSRDYRPFEGLFQRFRFLGVQSVKENVCGRTAENVDQLIEYADIMLLKMHNFGS